MSHITIKDPERLREVIEFAERAGCLDQLGRDLCRLLQTLAIGMTKDNTRQAELLADFAPHSFCFAIWNGSSQSRETLVLNGGWIYDGPGAPGDGSFPSLNVNLERIAGRAPEHSWSIHT